MKKALNSYLFILFALLAGVITGIFPSEVSRQGAHIVSALFMNFLKLVAAPIVSLSIISTLLGLSGLQEMRSMGRRVFFYTILTTFIATLLSLFLFLGINPLSGTLSSYEGAAVSVSGESYLSFFLNIVPSNLTQAFLDNNVLAITFVSFLLGIAGLKLAEENKRSLHLVFSSLFKLVLKATGMIMKAVPIAIWAFTSQLVEELQRNQGPFRSLLLYLTCVVGANLLQGFVVLPLFLKAKGLSPWKIGKGSSRALLLAFFSKSSSATLPVALESAEKNLKISPQISLFSLPLCTVINMNGCASFIFTTVAFVSGIQGHVFTLFDLGMWTILATIAAIGNAGVPMGCFFLSSTFLIGMGVPIHTLGLILPFYAFLDMIETALNVWSDLCVTALVDRDIKEEEKKVVIAKSLS